MATPSQKTFGVAQSARQPGVPQGRRTAPAGGASVMQPPAASPGPRRQAISAGQSTKNAKAHQSTNIDAADLAQPNSEQSVRSNTTKKKIKARPDTTLKKKKRGFGLFAKGEGPEGGAPNVSREESVQQKYPSQIMAVEASDARIPLKMIDSLPNDRTKIVMRRFVQMAMSKGVNGIIQEFNDIKATSLPGSQLKKDGFDKHPDKNRYKDTYCIEETRVVLKWPDRHHNDYIHANWTQNLPEMPKDIICTQGPTEKSVEDFWRMIWQEKCICIIMLCGIYECGKKKCEQYWPLKQGDKMVSCGLEIINKQTEQIAPDCTYTHLLVVGTGSDGGRREHFVNHLLWTGWPDRSVPATSTGILRLIIRTQSLQPVVVHCSAGVGRTGTIVALESCLRVLDSGLELSIYNIVKMLRSKRYMACQTELQYCYLHRAVMAFIISKNVVSPNEIVTFVEDYEKLVKSKTVANSATAGTTTSATPSVNNC